MTRDFEYYRVEQHGDVTVVTPTVSDLFDLMTSNELRKELIRFAEDEKPKKLVVNFRFIERFSTDWITTLLSLKRRLVNQGLDGDIRLCNLTSVQYEIFDILHLPQAFPILETVDLAVQSFAQALPRADVRVARPASALPPAAPPS